MKRFPVIRQHDAMQCGIACLAMICRFYGKEYSLDSISKICHATTEGVSLFGIGEAADKLGLHTVGAKLTVDELSKIPLPCILHWNQNHFVVLYDIDKSRKFYIADPGSGHICFSKLDFASHWISYSNEDGNPVGVVMVLEPEPLFFEKRTGNQRENRSLLFLYKYAKQYWKSLVYVLTSLAIGCFIQLVLPFLTQTIVDKGINNKDIGLIWLILLGQLVLTISRTIIDYMRRWILLKISMKINISLVRDFFIKLLKLPMSFFDTKVMGDLMQRKNDHYRVEKFLTEQTLNVVFSMFSFLVFSVVLIVYSKPIFTIFIIGSILYGLWLLLFLNKRKILDYELFSKQSENNNKTYQFLTTMQEIKLQNCEQRRRQEFLCKYTTFCILRISKIIDICSFEGKQQE